MGKRLDDRREWRTRPAAEAGLTLRSAGLGDTQSFYGHAAVFNSRTAIGNPLTWGFYEEVMPGAFRKTFSEGDTRFLVDHSSAMIVSRVSAGDLRVREDSIGAEVDADLDLELSYVRDLARNVEKRRVTGMSFEFMPVKDDWSVIDVQTEDAEGRTFTAQAELRQLIELNVPEVSAVTFPAYPETDATLRALRHRSDPDPLHRRESILKAAARTRDAGVTQGDVIRAMTLMTELREGKTLSAANVNLLQGVLTSLAAADAGFDPLVQSISMVDEALDSAQADLAGLLGVADPDEPEPGETTRGRQGEPGETTRTVPSADYMRAIGTRYGLAV